MALIPSKTSDRPVGQPGLFRRPVQARDLRAPNSVLPRQVGMDLPDVRDLQEYDTVAFKTFSATASSTVAGLIIGAVTATWQDVPAVERNVALPALKKTGRVMGSYGILYGAIGGTFALVEALSENIRGKKDFVNGVFGGFAAGSILGFRAGRVPVGLGAGAAMAAISAFIDAGGQTTRVQTGREYLPYPKETEKYAILASVDKREL